MKFAVIEAKFTAKVAEYIAKGYTFNAHTMRGSQGEIAKVDLHKGEEIIRIILVDEYRYDDTKYSDRTVLIVGRNTQKLYGGCDTIWNHKLEVIEREEWAKVADDWYLTVEEVAEANKKAESRLENKPYTKRRGTYYFTLDEKAAQIVLPFIRRQKGYKRCKVSDIRVRKCISDGKTTYTVQVGTVSKSFTLH